MKHIVFAAACFLLFLAVTMTLLSLEMDTDRQLLQFSGVSIDVE